MTDYLVIILLYLRRTYAMWAMQYVPILIDGRPNPEWDRLHTWATCDRVQQFIDTGNFRFRRRWRRADSRE